VNLIGNVGGEFRFTQVHQPKIYPAAVEGG